MHVTQSPHLVANEVGRLRRALGLVRERQRLRSALGKEEAGDDLYAQAPWAATLPRCHSIPAGREEHGRVMRRVWKRGGKRCLAARGPSSGTSTMMAGRPYTKHHADEKSPRARWKEANAAMLLDKVAFCPYNDRTWKEARTRLGCASTPVTKTWKQLAVTPTAMSLEGTPPFPPPELSGWTSQSWSGPQATLPSHFG